MSGREPLVPDEGEPVADDVDVDDAATAPPHGDPVAEDALAGPSPQGSAGGSPGAPTLEEYAELVTSERDDYLGALRRTQADFENYRKRVMKQSADDLSRAAEALVDKLLPVLDACDGAVRHGATEVEPIFASLLGTLEKEGLARIDPAGEPFDPTVHEAVMHEPGEGETVVVDVMRTGYAWKGRVIRPAMVKVQGS